MGARRRTLRTVGLGLGLGAVVWLGCRLPLMGRFNPRDAAPARAQVITSAELRVEGPTRTGGVGDIRIENGQIVAAITRDDPAGGFAASGGNLVDLALVGRELDHLNEVFLYLNDEFPRQAQYARVEIVDAGGGRRPARVLASGRDTHDPRIAIETEYRVAPGQPWMTLTTRFTSSATATIEAYEIGDAVQWGRTEHMAPGHGFDLPGRRMSVDWISGIGAGVSYAVVPDGPSQFDCINGSMWSDPIGKTVSLKPGEPVTYRRHIVVGDGDTASLAAAVSWLRRDATGRLHGRVRAASGPVGGARVSVMDADSGQLVGVAEAGDDGRYEIVLPPARYRLRADAPGRAPVVRARVKVRPERSTIATFAMPPQSRLSWTILDEAGQPVPVRIGVHGVEGTETPRFGPSFRAEGAERFVFSHRGSGEIPLEPGRYRLVASQGIEHALVDEVVTVDVGETASVQGVLRRAFATPGLIAADLHQHAAPSFDSGVSLEDRVLSNATEGVEVLVASDHNALTDYTPIIAQMGLQSRVRSVVGVEATTHSVGHFNALPLEHRPSAPRGGMLDPEGWSPDEIFDFIRGLALPGIVPFLQVNHPRSRRTGYFSIMGLGPDGEATDPRYSSRFDGVEILSLGYPDETRQAREDWFALLRRGRRVTGTGTSDSHTLTRRPPGWPRTMVCVDDDQPQNLDVAAFTAALRGGCATISAGPVVTIATEDARMGGLARAADGRVSIRVRIQAADWVATDRLTLYVDGRPARTIALSGRAAARHDETHELSCPSDCFIVAEVDADATLDPVVLSRERMNPSPRGLTNPIYVDVDGDGRYR